jgi:hypothetical protein
MPLVQLSSASIVALADEVCKVCLCFRCMLHGNDPYTLAWPILLLEKDRTRGILGGDPI